MSINNMPDRRAAGLPTQPPKAAPRALERLHQKMLAAVFFMGISASVISADIFESSPAARGTQKSELLVTVKGIRNSQGRIVIQLWNAPAGFPQHSEKRFKEVTIDASSAVAAAVNTSFKGLAPGTYAVSTLHDENNNGRMDTNAFGAPREGVAVSNNVVKLMRAPSFDEASFQLPADGGNIVLELRY